MRVILVSSLVLALTSCSTLDDADVVVIGVGELTSECELVYDDGYHELRDPLLYDISRTSELVIHPVLENRRFGPSESPSCLPGPDRCEGVPPVFSVRRVEARIRRSDGGWLQQTIPIPGAVEPNGGRLIALIRLALPPEFELSSSSDVERVELSLQITGEFSDGSGYGDASATFPIQLCNGCLANVPDSELCDGRLP